MSTRAVSADVKRAWKRRRHAQEEQRVRARRERSDAAECAALSGARALEREIDRALRERRERLVGACREEGVRAIEARMRVYVFHSGGEGDGFALRVCGRRLREGEDAASGGGEGPWMSGETYMQFSTFVRGIEVALDGEKTTRAWRSEDEVGAQHSTTFDGFELRGRAPKGTREATIRIEMNGDRERYKVASDLAELIAAPYATRKRTIAELWTYFTVNGLVEEDDASQVTVDAPMRAVLVDAGMEVPSDGKVKFMSVCETALGKLLTKVEPFEIKYKIDTSGPSPSKPDCYDFDVEMSRQDLGSLYALGLGDPPQWEKNIEQCELRIRRALPHIDVHLQRRNFLLRFAESPVDFINSCVRDQALSVYETKAENLSYLRARDAPERPAPRGADTYREPWVDEAIMRML